MEIKKRKYYFKKIKPFIGKQLIKVITGQRRSGKSYFLYQIMDEIKNLFPDKTLIYIDKEKMEFDTVKDYKDLVQYAEKQKGKSQTATILIDEVQEIKEFERALRHLLSTGNWDIYITGSNADMLSGELATLLSGRYIAIEMFPLAYPEFLFFHNLQDNAVNFNKYIIYGGMPFLCNLPLSKEIAFEYLQNITNTILFKDVVARYKIRDIDFLENLVGYLAANTGNLISAKRISDYLKSQKLKFNHNTVMDYLNYISKASLTHRIKRFDIQGKRIMEIGEKGYFTDTGIRNSITGYNDKDIALIFENLVFNHLKRKNNKVYIGKFKDREIDFVAFEKDQPVYIQVTLSLASPEVKAREIGNLLLLKDNYRKIVITGDEYTSDQQGVEGINIRKFLMES